ncbi:hypothetical protein CHLRE_16g685573v5 [Chlamydomonas reinhardtii]|uniref:Uncharacterized protein n=1 Tax=Chlamydomonas reinhardtii TaxID=3055 RepID=A8JBB0_CHLRE|nr:uncharacterized protein CHLRE_16g685573v5 [Chlamydomonas reinhardtii]PNW71791.1 hypothetical protein CHLRE_16g685573v5 [Chlamydomonas reinhardtii]|eukprot:XP_001699201.1 flagellar associated protein [Chlamydomonas reinhardtii]
MSVTEYITRLTIKSARDLPKTDRLSKIDPYMVILVNGQQFRTKVKDDNENPDWNETFGARLLKHPTGLLQGSLELNLYDEDTFADSYVAKYVLDLSTLTQAQLGIPLTFSMEYVKDKYKSQGKHPTITVQFDGLVQSFYSLRSMFAPMPGFLTDDTTSACFIPITESNGLIYVCVDYDSGGKIDFKVYVTRPNVPIYLDLLVLAGAQYTKVRRRLFRDGHAVAGGRLTVYEELKLDDVPVSVDFNNLSLIVFDSHPLSSTNADVVVTAHGWKGAMNFTQAREKLKNVEVDEKKQEIYMTVDAGETMLLVDYDRNDADIKLAVLASPSTADKGYDLTIRGQNVNKMSELYVPPIPKLHGQFHVTRLFELDDLQYGTRFDDIEILRFQLSNPRQYTIQGLTRIMG